MRKNYFWYRFYRHVIVGSGLKLFYSDFYSSGLEHIPKNKPIVFVPNHQNSFMDALLVACSTRTYLYFMTRAEAFNPPALGWFLKSLNMLPIYRVRDGFSSVQKNNAIFDECYNYLSKNWAVLIFAEANHNLKRRIRPLSKGFTRIAFGAEEKFNWELDLQVIPVGVNYSKHREARNQVYVKYGEPIPAAQFKELYKKDKNAASQHLKEAVSEGMKKIAVHVPDLEEYPLHKILLDDLEPHRGNLINPSVSNPRIQKIHEIATEERVNEAKELVTLAEKNDLDLNRFTFGKQWSLKDGLLFPVYIFSFLNNIIPYQPVKHLTTNVIKDHAFDASIKFLSGLAILPLFYLIICLILFISGVSGVWILSYLLMSCVTAPAFVRAKELFSPNPANKLKKSNPKLYADITSRIKKFRDLRSSIVIE